MKTLIVEIIEPKRIGELVTVGKKFCDKPDIVALGAGNLPGSYGKAYHTGETIGSNLISSLADLIAKEEYEVILLSATTLGTSVAGPLSVCLSAPIVTEVIRVTDDHIIEAPMYGGKAVARFKASGKRLILTIRRKYFERDPLDGLTDTIPLPLGPGPVSLVTEERDKTEGIPLEDAEVIVTGGRGIGNSDNFSALREMAGLFPRGAVGASRGAVDEGWAPPALQIGQTGKIVAPSVYFAVGVSGASQHLAGIANSKCVVAINKDEEANIFKRARFGIVCDYKKALPQIVHALKEEA
jgi:electron transfer flavoprotein alpha subunit